MQSKYQFDLVVIGSGPAGEGAAINASRRGKRVAIIDKNRHLGGNCTHFGTIPSKALRHLVYQLLKYNTNPLFRKIAEPISLSFFDVSLQAKEVVLQQVQSHTQFLLSNRIEIYCGHAKFNGEHSLEILGSSKVSEQISFDQALIATGSRPYRPDDIDFNHERVYDSDTILTLAHAPRRMILYGAGVIGCEYASILSCLGIQVDLINTRSELLSFLDSEISDALGYHLSNNKVIIRHNEEYERLETHPNGVTLYLKSGKKILGDAILWCNGRTGNTEDLGLELLDLEPNNRGQLEVNQAYQTTLPHIFAAGDVIGWPSLASAAYDQGRSAADNATHTNQCHFIEDIPTGIYTLPEISSVGKTEKELTDEQVPYEVGKAFFRCMARAQISDETTGMLKILFHRESLQVLGVHCFGYEAAEIIHIGQAIMRQKGEANTLLYFIKTTFNYPTMAEAYREAAYDGLNRL